MRYREAWYIRAFDAFDRIPSWAQPAVVGSAILGAIVSIRPVFAIPAILAGKLQPASQALVILGSAMGAGVAGGFAYSLIGRRLLHIPAVGRYLTGMVCIAAYLTPLTYWSDRLFFRGERMLDSPTGQTS